MIVNQANLHGLTVGYSTAFNKSFDTTQSNYQKVATVVPSTTGEQDYKWLGQMPGMREWIGEREVQALAAYDYLIKNKKFEMTIGVPRDDIEDDKYGVYTPLFSNMGEAAALHPDELVFGAMMSGFNEKCYDGLSFFNTAHKVGNATYSNRSNKKLSRESYMEGRSSIMSIKGDKDKSLKLVPDLLVVPPALEETARLILEADQIDGTTNVLKGTAKLHVEPALAEHPEYWFLLCTNRFLKPFIYQLRKKIKFTSLTRDTDENVFMLDEYLYGADGRSNAGYGFWQMAYCFKTEPDAGGNELKFYCCENTVIDAGEPVGRVLVEAEATGTYYNIAPGRITISMIHLDGVDYVTNEDDWLFEEGAEEEDLEDLRDRCMSSWAELATRTIEEKLRNAAKAVPGVLDARIDAQHPRGQGTVDVIVTGAAGEASPELIRKVGEAIEPLKGNYEDYLVKSSEVVRQDFELVIYLAEDAATDGVDAQATKLIEDMMALTRGEMNTLYRDSIIQVLSTKIDNYRKTDILQPSDDMVLEQDKVIMAGDINVTVRNVVQSARGKE